MVRKARRQDHRERATALAKAVHAEMTAYNLRLPHEPFVIDDNASRILENDPGYHPPRKRSAKKKRKPTENPGIFTVLAVAKRLDTTVGALLREHGFEVTNSDLRTFRWIADFFRMRFVVDAVEGVAVPDEQSFLENEFSFPRQPPVTGIDRKGQFAAGPTAVESDFELTAAAVIGSMETTSLFATQVKGRSMADRLRDGDTIVIDSAQTMPKQGEPVAVYIENEGGVLGYWRAEAGAYYLDKHNLEFRPVKLGHPSEWRVLGVIKLVQSRMSRQDRQARLPR